MPPDVALRAARGIEPAFFVLGAQKAGTTTLHEWLAARAELALPRMKETHYLCDEERWALGEAWYASTFASTDPSQRCGEVDPEYLYSETALRRLHARWPSARLVVVLRSPLERSRSHHEMTRARGLEPLDFEAALEAEAERLGSAGAEAAGHHAYFDRSRQAAHLERLERLAPGHALHLVRADELFGEHGAETWQALLAFLGLDTTPIPTTGGRNGRWRARSGWLNRHLRSRTPLRRLLGRLLPSRELRLRLGLWMDRWNQRPLGTRAPAAVLNDRWLARFDAEVAAIERCTGWDCSTWYSGRRGEP